MQTTDYRGRFAPSPTGPLHFGSLLTALGSYLDAKSQGGLWLLRIDDLDPPRVALGATDVILRALEVYGLEWDGAVQYQNQRNAAYACACSRREIADSQLGQPAQALIYPGTCRQGLAPGKTARAWRLNTQGVQVSFEDRLQGAITQNLAQASGDFVVQRADGLFVYQLAAVVDDAALGITQVVRGTDLLDCTLRQVYLQQLLGLATPRYLHLPVVLNAQGEKLSKQTLAPALDLQQPQQTMLQALTYLNHTPPPALKRANIKELLEWSINNWNPAHLPRLRTIEQTDF